MKLPESLQPKRLFAKPSKDRRGVALVTVLTVMALTTILVLTFFSLATSEHRASNVYSNGLQAQQVAEQAVNMVIAQIREATVSPDGSNGDPFAWASQPGVIRNWDENGNQRVAFKLYSDDNMKTEDWTEFQTDFGDASDWSSQRDRSPDHFVDLNEPVIRGTKVFYPIVYPSAENMPQWPQPLGNDQDGIEGFSFNDDLKNTLRDAGDLARKAAELAGADEHLAMPVRWIYQLADGTLGVLSDSPSGGGSTGPGYRFNPISGGGTPSAENPMVSRFAFWADDETSKLNINTHAGGLAWDVPKAGGELDMAMGKYQPAQKEWQRYPGHPATTHLIPALAPGVLDIVNDRDAMEMLFEIVPRVVGGGSESGTRVINTRDKKEQNGLIADTDPLFPTLDDMIMRPDREPHKFPDAKGNEIPEEDVVEHLERSKFFLTANSRAPETNMFNQPRIAMWPIYNATNEEEKGTHWTSFDRLIAYCASMGKSGDSVNPRLEYIFRREKADSSTHDIELKRNRELYEYLVDKLESKIPGYGGAFSDKYGRENAAQIATMIFDYIRCTNLHDDTVFGEEFNDAFEKINNNDHRTFTNPRDGNEFNKGFGLKGHGQVTPTFKIQNGAPTKGMGRFFTLSSAEILVSAVAQPIEAGVVANRYQGVVDYRGRQVESPSTEPGFTNLPPLPLGCVKEDRNTWPQWLKDLKDRIDDPLAGGNKELMQKEFDAAFLEKFWNWQLAFLDPHYRKEVLKDPTAKKFRQDSIADFEIIRIKNEKQKLVQAIFLFDLFCPSVGWISINPNMEIEIEKQLGFEFKTANGTFNEGFIGFEDTYHNGNDPDGLPNTFVWATNWNKPIQESGARAYGGLLPFTFMLSCRDVHGEKPNPNGYSLIRTLWNWPEAQGGPLVTSPGITSRLTPIDRGYNYLVEGMSKVGSARPIGGRPEDKAQAYRYDLVTVPFLVDDTGFGVSMDRSRAEFRIYDGGKFAENEAQDDADDAGGRTLVQAIEVEFPPFNYSVAAINPSPGRVARVNEFNDLSVDNHTYLEAASLTADPANHWDTMDTSANMKAGSWRGSKQKRDTNYQKPRNDREGLNVRGRMGYGALHWGGPFITAYDIVQQMTVPHGDMRVIASRDTIKKNEDLFLEHRKYGHPAYPMAHSLTNAEGNQMAGFVQDDWREYLIVVNSDFKNDPYRNKRPLPFARSKSQDVQLFGDFDNGAGLMIDGAYINKPDEGNVHSLRTRFQQEVVDYWEARRDRGEFPYFSNPEYGESGGPSYFSPNRIVSGPGMFGSLPTGMLSDPPQPWQTLLFRPNVVGNGYVSHPGAMTPPDHLLMDLFWMPVVEPYAISEPLSTAGKINMNYQIVPFLHVNRDTALRGVFRSEVMLCIPNKWHRSYKHNYGRGEGYHWRDNPYGGELQGMRLRSVIREDDTLQQFRDKFKSGEDIFKSATEICDIHLVPEEVADRLGRGSRGSIGSFTPTVSQMSDGTYWKAHALVGDNSRERPYTNIQTRLTTKSNTFLVHYRAQVIKQARRDSESDYGVWRPQTDTVQAEYRGSSIVERYVNPNDDDIPDFGKNTDATLDEFYQFRVVNPKRFAP